MSLISSWTSKLKSRRKTAKSLRSRLIKHGGSKKAPRLAKAYRRYKGLVAQATRGLARARAVASTPLREKALSRARANLGVMEHGGNNRGPGVEKIIQYAQGQIGEPWCADFVIWCYGHAGSKIVRPGYPRAVSLMLRTGVKRVSHPLPGDIVRYNFDHTGLVEKVLPGGRIQTIEGNTGATGAVSDSATGGDGVYRKIRSTSLVSDYLRVTK